MQNILNSYLNIIKILKIAKLSDAQYKFIYNNFNDFEADLDVELSEEEGKKTGPTFSTKTEAFMFVEPNVPEKNIKDEFNITKGYVVGRMSSRNGERLLKILPQKYQNILSKKLDLQPLINQINKIIDYFEVNKDLVNAKNINELRGLIIDPELSGNLLNLMQKLYIAGVEENQIIKLIDLYIDFLNNPKNNQFIKKTLLLLSLSKAKLSVSKGHVDALKNKINIRESDIFDYLKNDEKWSNMMRELEGAEVDEIPISGEIETKRSEYDEPFEPVEERPTALEVNFAPNQEDATKVEVKKVSKDFLSILSIIKKTI